MIQFDPEEYGPLCGRLLQRDSACALGPGSPNEACRRDLESLNSATLAGPRSVVDERMADCCIAGLWLLHDFLHESHALSQQIPTATGSYWHGIMHRREPDSSNAKYWFRRVGDHPIFDPLCAGAAALARGARPDPETAVLARQSQWDPLLFIDLCDTLSGSGSPGEDLCRNIARLEWQLLFDYGFQRATGRP